MFDPVLFESISKQQRMNCAKEDDNAAADEDNNDGQLGEVNAPRNGHCRGYGMHYGLEMCSRSPIK